MEYFLHDRGSVQILIESICKVLEGIRVWPDTLYIWSQYKEMLIGQASGKLPEASNVALALLPRDTRFNPGATPYQQPRPLSQHHHETKPESYIQISHPEGIYWEKRRKLEAHIAEDQAKTQGESPWRFEAIYHT